MIPSSLWNGRRRQDARKDFPFPEVTELASLVAEVADDDAPPRSWTTWTHARLPGLDCEPGVARRLANVVLRGGPTRIRSRRPSPFPCRPPPVVIASSRDAYHRRRGE